MSDGSCTASRGKKYAALVVRGVSTRCGRIPGLMRFHSRRLCMRRAQLHALRFSIYGHTLELARMISDCLCCIVGAQAHAICPAALSVPQHRHLLLQLGQPGVHPRGAPRCTQSRCRCERCLRLRGAGTPPCVPASDGRPSHRPAPDLPHTGALVITRAPVTPGPV